MLIIVSLFSLWVYLDFRFQENESGIIILKCILQEYQVWDILFQITS